MITDLRPLDDDSIVAVGERYQLEKVLDAMCGIVDDFAAFAKAKGLAEPYTPSSVRPPRPDDDWLMKLMRLVEEPIKLPYGAHTSRLIRMKVMKEKAGVDAGGLCHAIEAPPFRFALHPLGPEPLYANFGACREQGIDERWLTLDGRPWTAFDPAPVLRIYRHLPARPEGEIGRRPTDEYRLTRAQRKLLTEFLETQRFRGVTFNLGAGGLVMDPASVHIPHAVFGAGRGDIRIALLRAGGD